MAWYADLTPCDYFGAQLQEVLLAVGWLERGHAFPTGSLPEPFFRPLGALLDDPCGARCCSAGLIPARTARAGSRGPGRPAAAATWRRAPG